MFLEELVSSIKFGTHFSSEKKGIVKYLKANHFDMDGELEDNMQSFVSNNIELNKFLLKEDEIIIAAKGYRNFAWLYRTEYGQCVASSLFYVLKVNTNKVLSEYLVLMLNSSKLQHQLKLIALGVSTPSIPKNELLKIKIQVPSKQYQQKLVNLNNTIHKQILIEKKIIEKKKQLQRGLIDLLTKTNMPTNKKVL